MPAAPARAVGRRRRGRRARRAAAARARGVARRAPRGRPALDADAARAEAAETRCRLRIQHALPAPTARRRTSGCCPPGTSPGPRSPARRCSARSRRRTGLPATVSRAVMTVRGTSSARHREPLSADARARHRPPSSRLDDSIHDSPPRFSIPRRHTGVVVVGLARARSVHAATDAAVPMARCLAVIDRARAPPMSHSKILSLRARIMYELGSS